MFIITLNQKNNNNKIILKYIYLHLTYLNYKNNLYIIILIIKTKNLLSNILSKALSYNYSILFIYLFKNLIDYTFNQIIYFLNFIMNLLCKEKSKLNILSV